MKDHTCVALLLAGGEGKRLMPLTERMAKPAVPFGGQYRIIDLTISNCVNSGISSIGVLTQYKAESIHSHLEERRGFAQDGKPAEIYTLPGSMTPGRGYSGTADAVYQNLAILELYQPEHVLILSGDHIYNMDYRDMLHFHIQHGSDATIAVKEVPRKEAHRFGIVETDEDGLVTGFEEKPVVPRSSLASLGIYIFNWSFLKSQLTADASDPRSSRDFGKDVIPSLLQQDVIVSAYPFTGYWRDVGTVESLWEAHMDTLNGDFLLDTPDWPIYAPSGRLTRLRNSLVHEDCVVNGHVERSFIGRGVEIGFGSEIHESIIMENVVIGKGVTLHRVIVAEGSVIEDGAVIGEEGGAITVIGAERLVFASSSGFMRRTNDLLTGLVLQDTAAINKR